MLLDRDNSFLLVVDIQEKLFPSVRKGTVALANSIRLVKAAAVLGIPVFATEHCPDRIGATVEPLRKHLPPDSVIQKVHFSLAHEPHAMDILAGLGRSAPVVCGTEAHVCVSQTALGLLGQGYRPYLVTDAVASRKKSDRKSGIVRMRDEGVIALSTESVLFEWLKRADTQAFRALLPLIKEIPS